MLVAELGLATQAAQSGLPPLLAQTWRRPARLVLVVGDSGRMEEYTERQKVDDARAVRLAGLQFSFLYSGFVRLGAQQTRLQAAAPQSVPAPGVQVTGSHFPTPGFAQL